MFRLLLGEQTETESPNMIRFFLTLAYAGAIAAMGSALVANVIGG